MPALEVASAPFPLDDPWARAAAEAVMAEEPVHPPGILVEIVGMQMSNQDCLCKEQEHCRDVLREEIVVSLCRVQLMVEGKEETVMAVVWVSDRINRCCVGFLPCHMVPRAALYNGALAQVTRVFNRNPDECNSAERRMYHTNKGYTHVVIISDSTGSSLWIIWLKPNNNKMFNWIQ